MASQTSPSISYSDDNDALFRRLLISGVEKATGQRRINKLYQTHRGELGTASFWRTVVERLRLTVNYDASRLSSIPGEGSLVVLANHPFGVLDGLVMGYLISQVRTDIKLMAHATLQKLPEMAPHLIPIKFSGASTSLRSNVESGKAAETHLKAGGCVLVLSRRSRVDSLQYIRKGRRCTLETVSGKAYPKEPCHGFASVLRRTERPGVSYGEQVQRGITGSSADSRSCP